MIKQINIKELMPFMKKGWVAMDKSGAYRWFLRKPYANEDYGVFRTDISCETCSLRCFDIKPVSDWTKSLIKVENKMSKKLKIKIEDLELKIFKNLDELKNVIKQNFNVIEMDLLDHTDIDCEIDDELAFCDGEYDYSVYYMTGKSGRIIVVETSKQTY